MLLIRNEFNFSGHAYTENEVEYDTSCKCNPKESRGTYIKMTLNIALT